MLELNGTDKGKDFHKKWMAEIADALKREKTYRRLGQESVDIYEAKHPELVPFNILYSNVEVLQPALYNSKPIPIVTRKYKDPDPVAKVAAEVSTRLLKYLLEAESADCDTFDEGLQSSVLDVIVTNRGLNRFKYAEDDKYGEGVYAEGVRWDKFFHGYARAWKKVPWIGFEWDMTEAEVRKNFKNPDGTPISGIDFKNLAEDLDEDSDKTETREQTAGVKLAKVYEIWDKNTKSMFFISAIFPNGVLRYSKDPLELVNFYPIPKPLNLMRKITTLLPTPLYEQYKSQAKELNEITRRLKAIIQAMKVRGMYNSAVEGIEKVLMAEDNTFTPVENMTSMPDNASIDKLLWFMPLAELATTAQNLFSDRERIKQVIYEITGISDILRGASVASETATAQNIKNQWGSLRLKKMQKEVQRYCRDCLAIMLEIAVTSFDDQTIAAMTGLPLMFEKDKQEIQKAFQLASTNPTEPPPPEVQKAMEAPSWEVVLKLLRDDKLRSYKIDIETNSTIDAEATQDKQDIAELLNSVSQFLNGVAPLIEKGVLPFEIAKEMLLSVSRRYTFGPQLEDALNMMQAPPKEDDKPDPAEEAKLAQIQAQGELQTQKGQIEMQTMQMELDIKKQEMEMESQLRKEEFAIKQAELQLQKAALSMKLQVQQKQHEMKLAQMKMQHEAAEAKSEEKETESAD
jgi:hypothetical protein